MNKTTTKAAKPTNAKAKAAPKAAKQAAAGRQQAPAPTPKAPTVLLTVGKEFKPRAEGRWAQQANWNALLAAFAASENGVLSSEQCVAVLTEAAAAGGYSSTANARGFVQGRVRGGHLNSQ